MRKPKILDLFCGAGGCAVGYFRAGFDVVGVDINPQPHYPFEFHQADAMQYPISGFDAVHASPPCQGYSSMTNLTSKRNHTQHIYELRRILEKQGCFYVIENVPAAKSHLIKPTMLCGTMFGLGVVRHRYFETNFKLTTELVCNHSGQLYTVLTKSCRFLNDMRGPSCHENGKKAMGIGWMNQFELGESVPPAYTEFIGKQLRAHVVCAECAPENTSEARLTAYNKAMVGSTRKF